MVWRLIQRLEDVLRTMPTGRRVEGWGWRLVGLGPLLRSEGSVMRWLLMVVCRWTLEVVGSDPWQDVGSNRLSGQIPHLIITSVSGVDDHRDLGCRFLRMKPWQRCGHEPVVATAMRMLASAPGEGHGCFRWKRSACIGQSTLMYALDY